MQENSRFYWNSFIQYLKTKKYYVLAFVILINTLVTVLHFTKEDKYETSMSVYLSFTNNLEEFFFKDILIRQLNDDMVFSEMVQKPIKIQNNTVKIIDLYSSINNTEDDESIINKEKFMIHFLKKTIQVNLENQFLDIKVTINNKSLAKEFLLLYYDVLINNLNTIKVNHIKNQIVLNIQTIEAQKLYHESLLESSINNPTSISSQEALRLSNELYKDLLRQQNLLHAKSNTYIEVLPTKIAKPPHIVDTYSISLLLLASTIFSFIIIISFLYLIYNVTNNSSN